jgi:hypothetical protein
VDAVGTAVDAGSTIDVIWQKIRVPKLIINERGVLSSSNWHGKGKPKPERREADHVQSTC